MVGRGRRWLARGWRVLRAALLVLAGALILGALALTLAPVRGALLAGALRVAASRLPGHLSVAEASWPAPGRLLLGGVVWLAEIPPPASAYGDTLLHVRRLELEIDLSDLAAHDLRVLRLGLEAVCLDVPSLTSVLTAVAAPADTASIAGDTGFAIPWFRDGAAVDVPSVVCEEIAFAVERAVVAPDVTVAGATATAVLDAGHAAPTVALELRGGGRAAGSGAAPWLVDLTSLELSAGYGPARGEIALETCRVVVAAAGPPAWEERWRAGGAARLEAIGTVRLDTTAVTLALEGSLDTPVASLLTERWPSELPAADYERLTARFAVDAAAARPGGVSGDLALELTGSPGWGRSRLVLDGVFDPERPADAAIRLDTLSVVLPGVSVAGSGSLWHEDYRLEVRTEVATPVPLLALAGPQAAALELAGDLDIALAGRGLPHEPGAEPVRARLRGGVRAVSAGEPGWLADVPDLAVDLVFDPVGRELTLDTCRVRVISAGPRDWAARWTEAGPAELDLAGVALLDTAAVGLDIRGALRAPVVALAADLWPAELPQEEFAFFEAGFTLAATGRRPGGVSGRLTLAAGGSPGWGRSRVALTGSYDPDIPAAADLRVDTLHLDLPGLLADGTGSFASGTYELSARAELATPSPLLALAGPELVGAELSAALAVEASGTGLEPEGRLELRADGRLGTYEIRNVRLEAERRGGATDLDLAADRVAAVGVVYADSLAATADHDPSRELPFGLAASVHRNAVTVHLDAAAGLDSVITVRLEDLRLLVAGREITLERPATLQLDTLRRAVSLDRLALAGDMGSLEVGGALAPDEIRVSLDTDLKLDEELLQELAPASFWSADGGRDLLVRGGLDLAGKGSGPGIAGDLVATLRNQRTGEELGARLELGLAAGDTSGLVASFGVTVNDTVVIQGQAVLPGRFDPRAGWLVDETATLRLVVPEQAVPIRRFVNLAPAETSAAGVLTIGAHLDLPPGGPTEERPGVLSGSLSTNRLRLTGPNRSRAEVKVDCRLEGSALDPRLAGTITIPSAFIRLPEISKGLHEVEGRSLLWEAARADTAGPARFPPGSGTADWGPEGEEKKAPPLMPDLDLRIHMPGNLRINGYGLDAELAGDLEVSRGYDADGIPGPALRGEVHTVSGTVKVMSRVFEIQVCRARFNGRVPADPELTMNMLADVSGTSIRVQVSGRASNPVVTLSSSPDMNEADIMAFLIFGRPINDLDNDQRGRMGQEEDPRAQLNENLAALAFAFGTRDIRNSMTGTLGVDMVEMGADSQGGSTLAAGKFIGPQILLKYHMSLEKSGTYFMTLEYFVSQMFRIVSTYGQGEEASGLELKWLRRY